MRNHGRSVSLIQMAAAVLMTAAGCSHMQALRDAQVRNIASVSPAALPPAQLSAKDWGEPGTIDGKEARLAKAGQDAWLHVKPWWTGGARPAEGQYWIVEILYKDTAEQPIIFSAFGNVAQYGNRSELHRFGGFNDGQWKTAHVPLGWDMIMARPEGGMAEFSVRSARGDVAVSSIAIRPLAKDRLASACERYNTETREWIARVQAAKKDRPRREFGEPQKPDESAVADGGVIVPYVRSYMQVIYPYSAPQKGETNRPLKAQLATNEFEPAAFGVYAPSSDLTNVRVTIGPLGHESDRSAQLDAEARTAEYALVQNNPSRAKDKTYAIFPERLWPMYPTQIRKGQSCWFWVTFHSDPARTKPGLYRGRVLILSDQGQAALEVSARVLPIRLLDMNQTDLRLGGCVTGLASRHEMEEMLRHNHNQINLWLAGVEPRIIARGTDDFDLDFTLLDEFMGQMKAAGLKSNVWFLGGDPYKFPQTLTLERELAIQVLGMTREQFVELANKDKMNIPPQIVPLYKKWVSKVYQHARQKGWPEQIVTPFDEPASWQQSIGTAGPWIRGHFDQACSIIHECAPQWRIYASIHHATRGLVYLPEIDVFCTNAIDDDPHLGDKVRAAGKVFWQYTGTGQGRPDQARYSFGFYFSAYDSRGGLCWAYNWGARFDTTEGSNWEYAWYTPLDVIPAPAYEGMREALDDRRYVETLRDLARSKNVDISGFLAQLAADGASLRGGGGRDKQNDFWAQARRVESIDELRARVIDKVLSMPATPGTAAAP